MMAVSTPLTLLLCLSILHLCRGDCSSCNVIHRDAYCAKAELSSIPNKDCLGVDIVSLDARFNNFDQLTNNFFDETLDLEHVDMGNNDIRVVEEDSLKKLSNLRYLDLSNNYIEIFSEKTFSSSEMLEFVDLSFNLITFISESTFENNSKLKYLNLGGNKLSKLPPKIFMYQTEIVSLHLYKNSLNEVHEALFANKEKLEYLDMSDNAITSVSDKSFKSLPALKTLHLYQNKLHGTLNLSAFDKNKRLQLLTLNSNKYSSIDASTFVNSDMEIWLHNNHWSCECDIIHFLDLMELNNVRTLENPVCSSPFEVKGIEWTQLSQTLCDPNDQD